MGNRGFDSSSGEETRFPVGPQSVKPGLLVLLTRYCAKDVASFSLAAKLEESKINNKGMTEQAEAFFNKEQRNSMVIELTQTQSMESVGPRSE